MADNLQEHIYLIWDNNGDIRAPPFAWQFDNLYNLVNELLLKVDGDRTKQRIPNKHNNIPSIHTDVGSEGGSVHEYATPVYSSSSKTTYIDPRDRFDLIPRALNDISACREMPLPRELGHLDMTGHASS
jgi:hypothetical protein